MTLAVTTRAAFATTRYRVSNSACTMTVTTPDRDPELWAAYMAGALDTYRKFGAEAALEYDTTVTGDTTSIFVVAQDADGVVVGGIRVQKILERPEDSHLTVEWGMGPQEGQDRLRAYLEERIPEGVVELKAGWVAESSSDKKELARAIARFFAHAPALVGVRFSVCSAASHAMTRWLTSGGQWVTEVPQVAYPDERYLTSMMCWDRHTVADLAAADQLIALMDEAEQLRVNREEPATADSADAVPTAAPRVILRGSRGAGAHELLTARTPSVLAAPATRTPSAVRGTGTGTGPSRRSPLREAVTRPSPLRETGRREQAPMRSAAGPRAGIRPDLRRRGAPGTPVPAAPHLRLADGRAPDTGGRPDRLVGSHTA